jgi:hypothetical protein
MEKIVIINYLFITYSVDFIVKIYLLLLKFFIFNIYLHLINEYIVNIKFLEQKYFARKIINLL